MTVIAVRDGLEEIAAHDARGTLVDVNLNEKVEVDGSPYAPAWDGRR
jgi:hypothetical protein